MSHLVSKSKKTRYSVYMTLTVMTQSHDKETNKKQTMPDLTILNHCHHHSSPRLRAPWLLAALIVDVPIQFTLPPQLPIAHDRFPVQAGCVTCPVPIRSSRRHVQ